MNLRPVFITALALLFLNLNMGRNDAPTPIPPQKLLKKANGKKTKINKVSAKYTLLPHIQNKNSVTFTVPNPECETAFRTTIDTVYKNNKPARIPVEISMNTKTGKFSWSPGPSRSGEYLFVFNVSCNSYQNQIAVNINVLKPEICNSDSDACRFLKEKQDLVAGNTGDWYHNSDRYHSKLNLPEWPQVDLMRTRAYTPQFKPYPGRVIIGNSSTALTQKKAWRSNQRTALLSKGHMKTLYKQYRNNNLYWYPEHKDHDDVDYYHGKCPYLLSSQGSSGSEMAYVKTFFYTVAAFKPQVKEILIENGLLMPTLQYIFRRSFVDKEALYLTGAAHPSAYPYRDITLKMMTLANSINPSEIPPLIHLTVIEETYGQYRGKNEKLFDTPASICRLFIGPEYTKTIIVSAENSMDLNKRPLAYHFKVLRGDPKHVRITPLNKEKSRVQIEIDYHPKSEIENSKRLTNMVEVGAFVHNGVHFSAPGFITSYTLDSEKRIYHTKKLIAVTPTGNYVHPHLSLSALPAPAADIDSFEWPEKKDSTSDLFFKFDDIETDGSQSDDSLEEIPFPFFEDTPKQD